MKIENNEYASEENYEKAKRMKNEINRIRNVIMNIKSRGYNGEVASSVTQTKGFPSFDKHNLSQNQSIYNPNTHSKSILYYDNVRKSNKEPNNLSFSDINNNSQLNVTENDLLDGNHQRSVYNLKANRYHK